MVGPRQSSPTFCQSASVGEPIPTPGILRMSALRLPACANAPDASDPTPVPATAPNAPAPFSTERLLILPDRSA